MAVRDAGRIVRDVTDRFGVVMKEQPYGGNARGRTIAR